MQAPSQGDCLFLGAYACDMNESQELDERLARLEAKVDAIFVSAEKTRRYFKATLIVTVLVIVLPAVGLVFAIPMLLSAISGSVLDPGALQGL